MRKISAFLIVLSLIFTTLGCSSQETHSSPQKEDDGVLKIVATNFPPYDFARQIAKDNAEITMILNAGGESHSYEPTLEDIAAIQNCDIFIYSGGDSDSWGEKILKSCDTSDITVIRMLDLVQPLYLHHENEDEVENHTHEGETPDEHVWTSPKNAIKIVEAISQAAAKADKAHQNEYKNNASTYIAELQKLDGSFKEAVENSKRKSIIFADRFPFLYFSQEYGLEHFEALEGCTSDTEPTLSSINSLIQKVKSDNIPAVFYIEFSSGTIADKICDATGAEKLLFHSCHSVSQEELKEGETYLSLMEGNLERLKKALA